MDPREGAYVHTNGTYFFRVSIFARLKTKTLGANRSSRSMQKLEEGRFSVTVISWAKKEKKKE